MTDRRRRGLTEHRCALSDRHEAYPVFYLDIPTEQSHIVPWFTEMETSSLELKGLLGLCAPNPEGLEPGLELLTDLPCSGEQHKLPGFICPDGERCLNVNRACAAAFSTKHRTLCKQLAPPDGTVRCLLLGSAGELTLLLLFPRLAWLCQGATLGTQLCSASV